MHIHMLSASVDVPEDQRDVTLHTHYPNQTADFIKFILAPGNLVM